MFKDSHTPPTNGFSASALLLGEFVLVAEQAHSGVVQPDLAARLGQQGLGGRARPSDHSPARISQFSLRCGGGLLQLLR